MSLVKWALNRARGAAWRRACRPASHGHVARLVVGGAGFRGTSVLGVLLLRRRGSHELARLIDALRTDGIAALRLDTPGAAGLLGTLLLVLPGFITDIVGGALFLPPFADGPQARSRKPRRRGNALMASVTASSISSLANGIRSRTKNANGERKAGGAISPTAAPTVPSERLVRLDSLC